jgi:hypothetical protein
MEVFIRSRGRKRPRAVHKVTSHSTKARQRASAARNPHRGNKDAIFGDHRRKKKPVFQTTRLPRLWLGLIRLSEAGAATSAMINGSGTRGSLQIARAGSIWPNQDGSGSMEHVKPNRAIAVGVVRHSQDDEVGIIKVLGLGVRRGPAKPKRYTKI